jgi:hypothetical protein
MGETFKHQGKPWSDAIKARVKFDIADLAASNPYNAMNPYKRSSFDALVAALETKLDQLTISKG